MMGIIIIIGDLIIRAVLSFLIVMFFNYFFQLKMKGKKAFIFFIIVFVAVSAILPIIVNYWITHIG